MPMTDQWLCGWRVRSETPLGNLSPWRGDDRPPDVTIRAGTLPQREDEGTARGPIVRTWADGTWRLAPIGGAFYEIDAHGREVLVAAPDAEAAAMRLFLPSTVLTALSLKRGYLPLHASAVRIGDAAVAFTGPSGAGKSTLAAALMRRGYPVITDDVAVLQRQPQGDIRIWPTFPYLKLRPDALAQLRMPPQGRDLDAAALEKYFVSVGDTFPQMPIRLAAVYHLQWTDARDSSIEPLRGTVAVRAIFDAVYRPATCRRLLGTPQLTTTAALFAAGVAAHGIVRRSRGHSVEELADRVIDAGVSG
jgi:energy-coupling factor transporter ATP-binding protein EcfA2